MEKITFVNESEPYLSAENLNAMQDNMENAIEQQKLKTQVYEGRFASVGNSSETGVNVDFSTMFPNLSLSDVICFNVEITDVYETYDRTYANIISYTGILQIRSYAMTQGIEVRVTAFYRKKQ